MYGHRAPAAVAKPSPYALVPGVPSCDTLSWVTARAGMGEDNAIARLRRSEFAHCVEQEVAVSVLSRISWGSLAVVVTEDTKVHCDEGAGLGGDASTRMATTASYQRPPESSDSRLKG